MKRIGIAGASECGKTTLAIHLSRAYWTEKKIATLALDPYAEENQWGKQAWVTKDEDKFWKAAWQRRGDLIIVDEASSTIARDRELIPVFTKIRHNKHTLLVICHDATDLVPTMRRMLNELFLFAQSEGATKLWRNDLPLMRGLEDAAVLEGGICKLKPYEFVHCENYKDGQIKKLAI